MRDRQGKPGCILKGAFRAFLYDAQANEHTVNLAIEDWWITDFNSYIYQTPATLFVEALEASTVVQLDHQLEQALLMQVPKFEKFFRILSQRALAALHRRILTNLSQPAEERYAQFVKEHPDLAHRVPQYVLASYLGFSTEYLSKIRKKQRDKN